MQDGLRTRLVTVFMLLSIAPLVLGSLISLVVFVSLTQHEVSEGQHYAAETISQNLDGNWRTSLNELAGTTAILLSDPAIHQSTIIRVLQQDCHACEHIWIVASDGQVVAETAPAAPLLPRLADSLPAVVTGKPVILAETSRTTDGTGVLIGVSIPDQLSTPHVLIAQLNVQQFAGDTLHGAPSYRNGYAYIVDATGHLLASTDPLRIRLGRNVQQIPLVQAATQREHSDLFRRQVYTGLFEPRVTGVWSQMAETGWYVLVEAPLTTLGLENWTLFGVQAGLLLLTGTAALVIGRRLAATITHPLEQLAYGVAGLQAGRWDIPQVTTRDDEIGQLALVFRIMAQKLQQQHVALSTQTETLIRTNDELQLALQAEYQANAHKSQFVATISHELRTPLTAILGYTDLLQEGVYGPIAEIQQQAWTSVHRNSKLLLQLINDLLDFSKLDAGKLELTKTPSDLSEVVISVITTCLPQAQSKGLHVTAIIHPATPTVVYMDSLRVRQVLMNLLSNAIKFTEQGNITVQVHSEPLPAGLASPALAQDDLMYSGALQNEVQLVLSVEDTGIGIALEDQRIIFNEFRQVETYLTRKFAGTGLGLAITKRLVHLMDGTIQVTSQIGIGSRFIVNLPVRASVEATIVEVRKDGDADTPSYSYCG